MSIELFWASGSPFSWRLQLALELKGVSYESRLLQFSQGETRTPEFRAISPRGHVPALRDGAFALDESVACLVYIDRKHPEPPLFGRSPEEAGRIWRVVSGSLCHLDEPTEAFTLPLYFGREQEKADQVRQAARTLTEELGRLDRELYRAPFLADAQRPTAADCVVYPMVRAVQRAAEKPGASAFTLPFWPLLDRVPAVWAWMKRIEALPGFDRTYPPHWRG